MVSSEDSKWIRSVCGAYELLFFDFPGKTESHVVLQQLLALTEQIKLVHLVCVLRKYIQKVQMVLILTQFACQETRSLQLQVMTMDFYVYIEIHSCLVVRGECTEEFQNM